MIKYIIIFASLIILTTVSVTGQTVSLPDTNLRNKLLADYPEVMDGDELNTADASGLMGSLDLRNADISNAGGVQHFTSITTLNLSDNQLTTLPDISDISGLHNFYANNNELTSMPDMTALTQLRDFQVMDNQLTALPGLSGEQLSYIYCSGNNITSLPPLTSFPELTRLVAGRNPLAEPVDVSSNTLLRELHLHQTNADTIIGLGNLTSLEQFYAWGNNIRDFSALDSITTLRRCVIYDNPLPQLPYLENKADLEELVIVNCRLTFRDLLPLIADAPPPFSYAPQRPVKMEDQEARAETAFTMEQPLDNPLDNNIYVWKKDSTVLDSSTSQTLPFDPVAFSDSGKYVLEIHNPDVPGLVLSTDTFTLTVKPCLTFGLSSLQTIDKDCSKGYTLDVSNADLTGGTTPFAYTVENNTFQETYSDAILKNIPAGKYDITITDANGCTATDHFTLDRIKNCDPVITPNGDGVADTYYIEQSGTAKIYNLKRQLVKTLKTPANWDATNDSGRLLDAGYYIVIVDDHSPVYVTIVR